MYHPKSEELVDLLIAKTGSTDRHFFRVLVGFYMSTAASMQRTNISTYEGATIPVNMYALSAAVSGYGKNYASNTLEELLIKPFEQSFISEVFTSNANKNIPKLAVEQSRKFGSDPDDAATKIYEEFESLGPLVTTFDSATSAAVKQLRKKLLIANAGSLNLIIDEIGSNLTNNTEALIDYLSLFDRGLLKQKITKNTAENRRGISIDGATPANLLMFGTPNKLLDGSRTEDEFISLLDTGYARRLFFAFVRTTTKTVGMTAEDIYERAISTDVNTIENNFISLFSELGTLAHYNRSLPMDKATSIQLIEYRISCEERTLGLKPHQEMLKSELSHRYYKALKLAGAYAFIDKSSEITQQHLSYAIQLAEDSGEAFSKLMNRERNYVKLAKYLATMDSEVTQADLVEDLPLYNVAASRKNELMSLAVAYGYKNNIIIKRTFIDGIEFFSGESLQETDLNQIIVSWSDKITEGYTLESAPFTELHKLVTAEGLHYVTHALKNGYRNEESCITGCNIVVLDVDGGISLSLAEKLLSDYTYLMYETKRSTPQENRFRIILPLSHIMYLDADTFNVFMDNIFNWVPFDVDRQTGQRSRKWLSNPTKPKFNQGKLLDATLFIPKTKKAEERNQKINEFTDITNLERWFIQSAEAVGRNNTCLKYGHVLLDKGYATEHVLEAVKEFNARFPKPLTINELEKTVLHTLQNTIKDNQ